MSFAPDPRPAPHAQPTRLLRQMARDRHLSLAARVRAAEAAATQGSTEFWQELDAIGQRVRQVGRRTARQAAIGGVIVAALGLLSVLGTRGWRRRSAHPARSAEHAADPHAASARASATSASPSWLQIATWLAPMLLAPRASLSSLLEPWMPLLRLLEPLLHPGKAPPEDSPDAAPQAHASTAMPPDAEFTAARRFSGDWIEYARLPDSMLGPCIAGVSLHCEPAPDGEWHVIQRGVDRYGRTRDIPGRARRRQGDGTEPSLPTPWEITFAPDWLHWLPAVWTPCWAAGLEDGDPAYQHALVGTADRQQLWLLSRSPEPSAEAVQKLVSRAQAAGFDIERLQRTPQAPA